MLAKWRVLEDIISVREACLLDKILVTGGAGFIGSHFVRYALERNRDLKIINLDLLTYAGNLENLADLLTESRHQFVRGDVADSKMVGTILPGCNAIVNFAAESHVDRSILGPEAFVHTNIIGTHRLLDLARKARIKKFVQVSTDEVYGTVDDGKFTEDTPIAPNSPYSASKASADLLCRSYYHTYEMDISITRCSNNYGPYQFPEKLIPLMINNARQNKPVPVYGDGLNVRDWIHVKDHCAAIYAVLEHGRGGEVYNIGADNERKNIDVVKKILAIMKKPESLIAYVKDRPGHDRRYAIDSTKIKTELGWKPEISFDAGLLDTVNWYLGNQSWLDNVVSGSYKEYYEKQYKVRLKKIQDY